MKHEFRKWLFDLQLHAASKNPSRVIDGPYANWADTDELCQISLANNGQIQLGQPVCIDVTQLGPDANVPNNGPGFGGTLPLCERVVATTSANAGPIFGVVSGVQGAPTGITLTYINGFSGATVTGGGVPTWTNKSGSTLVVNIWVRQQGWGYVLAGTAAIGQTGGHSILVGSQLITTTAQVFAIQGTAAIQTTIGVALATAINTVQQQIGAALGPGVVSVLLDSLVGVVPPALVLVDTLASGVQEAVSIGSISYPTASIALANAHTAGFRVTGPNAGNAAINTVLISTPGAGKTVYGLVAAFINVLS